MKRSIRPLPRRRALALAFAALLGLAAAPAVFASEPECEVHTEDLKSGVPVSNLTANQACPSGPVFTIEVPPGATHLSVSTMGGTGNADLFLRLGAAPTTTVFDHVSGEPGNNESIQLDNPLAGTWYVQVFPRATFAGVTLQADLTAPETEVEDGVPHSNLGDDQPDGVQYFTVNVPAGAANLTITTTGGTGNVDLFVRRAALPTTVIFDAASRGRTNTERVDIPSPQGGIFKIALVASSPFSGVTLLVTVTPSAACPAGPATLCLLGGRFKVEVSWTNQHSGNVQGVGQAIPGTDQTGYFWFFSPDNTELVVKMLDGRTLNGHFWFFHGGLSDVDYLIKVTDTQTGVQQTYHNPPGTLSSRGDTTAF